MSNGEIWSPNTDMSKYGHIDSVNDTDTTEKNENVTNKAQIISGMGVESNLKDNEAYLEKLFEDINNKNSNSEDDDLVKQIKAEQEKRHEEEKRLREANRLKLLKEQAEEEARQRAEYEEQLQKEEEQQRIEEEKKKANNPLYKIGGTLAKWGKKAIKKDKKDVIDKDEENITEENKILNDVQTENDSNNTTTEEVEDVPENDIKIEEDYKYLATHDTLTNLKNERAYQYDTENMLVKNTAIIFCDANNLKYLNDNIGHEAGDRLLCAISEKLNELYPEKAYRVGGDEFLVVLENIKGKDIKKRIENPIKNINEYLDKLTKESTDGVIYSVSMGYCIGTTEKNLSEIRDKADKEMYKVKQAYKKAHSLYEVRKQEIKPPVQDTQEKVEQPEYDELLSKSQKKLKQSVQENHLRPSEINTESAIREIQRRADDVIAILIADKNFNTLCIISDVDMFINMVLDEDSAIDYSFMYVVWEGGTQFYGSDTYSDEITELFKRIGDKLKSSYNISNKEIQAIEGINIFKNIYIG